MIIIKLKKILPIGGHWGSSVCLDYLEVWTDKQKSKSKLCGTWDVANDRLTTHGSNQNLFGYCYDDNGKAKSCEATSVFVNVAIDADEEMTKQYGLHLVNKIKNMFCQIRSAVSNTIATSHMWLVVIYIVAI